MSAFDTTVHLAYLACASCFVLGLHLMNAPATARRGNQLSAAGMAAAVALTAVVLAWQHHVTAFALAALIAGIGAGAMAGLITARRVKMTAMPQLVSLFNAVGGGAAALIALGDAVEHSGTLAKLPPQTTVTTVLDLMIGGVTFSGSLIASGKLAGILPGRPIAVRGGPLIDVLLAVSAGALTVLVLTGHGGIPACAASPSPHSVPAC